MTNQELRVRFSAYRTETGYVICYENFNNKWKLSTPYYEDFEMIENIDELNSYELMELRKKIINNRKKYNLNNFK